MRVALVAMPWLDVTRPSAALGILSAYVRREEPSIIVDCKYPHVALSADLGNDLYNVITNEKVMGDIIFAGHLYPGKRETIRAYIEEELPRIHGQRNLALPGDRLGELFDHIYRNTSSHIEQCARDLAGSYDVVGFTITYNQLFSSLAVSKRVKEIDPSVIVIFGGSGLSPDADSSVRKEYPWVDHSVHGPGELRLLRILREIKENSPPRHQEKGTGASPQETGIQLDDMPVPDYREYQETVEELGSIDWIIPIEGSRGCWWQRVYRTKNPLHTCYFCNNRSEPGYQEKSAEKIAQEMAVLSERHSNIRFAFTDNIVRSKGIAELAGAIKQQGRHFQFFIEIRSSIRTRDLLLLREAGCSQVQVGVESFSNSYLRRLGKGTTAIMNLQTMKTCFELGIECLSNILVGFPGATRQEVDETADHILDYAIAYQPLAISPFTLEPNSVMATLSDHFGLSNLRNAELYKAALDDEVWARLPLPLLDYDYAGDIVDWSRIQTAIEEWHELHRRIRRPKTNEPFFTLAPLYYREGDRYLDILDRRKGEKIISLDDVHREVYLYCTEIRSVNEVIRRFSDRCGEGQVKGMLDAFVDEKLMFLEKGRCLSLAVAPSPSLAAERIRALAVSGLPEKPSLDLRGRRRSCQSTGCSPRGGH